MYEYIPKKTNQRAVHAIGISMIGGAAVLGLAAALPTLPFRWAVQLVGIALLAVAIFFYTRYMAKAFVYRVIETENGTLDFLVDEYQRKRRTTVCRIGVAGIAEVVILKAGEKEKQAALKARLRAEKRRLFDYTVDFLPDEVCYVFCEEGGEPLVILIQPDETLRDILLRSVKVQ